MHETWRDGRLGVEVHFHQISRSWVGCNSRVDCLKMAAAAARRGRSLALRKGYFGVELEDAVFRVGRGDLELLCVKIWRSWVNSFPPLDHLKLGPGFRG